MLRPDEYAAYVASDKPRQLAAVEVTRRLDALSTARPALTVPAYALLDRGVAASGALTSIKLQALPLAITLTCTGFLLLFLFTYPLAGLAIKKGVGAHDDAMESVWFTLAIQFFQARTRAKRDEGREESARALAKTTTPDAPSPLSPSSPPSQFAVINILLLRLFDGRHCCLGCLRTRFDFLEACNLFARNADSNSATTPRTCFSIH